MDQESLIVTFIIIAFFALLMASMALAHGAYSDTIIGALERHYGVTPGQTRVLPECGCTVRYIGTAVHGHRYTVILDRLD